MIPYYAVGITPLWRAQPMYRRDGTILDLTGLTVRFVLRDPEKIDHSKVPVVENEPAGVASYTALATDLNIPGAWARFWRVTDSGGNIVYESRPVYFEVYE